MALSQMKCCCLICFNWPEEALKSPATPDTAQRESLLSSDYFINTNPLCSLLIKPS